MIETSEICDYFAYHNDKYNVCTMVSYLHDNFSDIIIQIEIDHDNIPILNAVIGDAICIASLNDDRLTFSIEDNDSEFSLMLDVSLIEKLVIHKTERHHFIFQFKYCGHEYRVAVPKVKKRQTN